MTGPGTAAALFLEARAALFREPLRERQRIAVVMALRNLVATTERLASAFEEAPDDDEAIEVANQAFARELRTADVLLAGYRNLRMCAGEA